MTKNELQDMIDEMVDEAIEEYTIIIPTPGTIKAAIEETKIYKNFKKLYKKAMDSKQIKDINEALEYYEKVLKRLYGRGPIPIAVKNKVKKLEKLKEEIKNGGNK